MQLVFFFGRNDYLSLAELFAWSTGEPWKPKVLFHTPKLAVLDVSKDFPLNTCLNELAGTVKIAQIVLKEKQVDGMEAHAAFGNLLEDFPDKGTYTISDYDGDSSDRMMELRELMKDALKSQKKRTVFKWPKSFSQDKRLETFAKDLKRRHEHVDVNLFSWNADTVVAKTIQWKDPAAFVARDEKRPVQQHILTTSLRLANILVNLSESKKGEIVFDPFCGMGTILQESMIQGKNVVGMDLDIGNVEATEKNLHWAKKTFSCPGTFKIYPGDSSRLENIVQSPFDCVVTEPYLGPYLRDLPSRPHAERIINELTKLYGNVFSGLGKRLKKGGKVVIILPQIPHQGKGKSTIAPQVFYSAGFRIHNVIESIKPGFFPYLYKDPENKIERLIYVLEKV